MLKFQDIVQSSVPDGHRLLAYKILMGWVGDMNVVNFLSSHLSNTICCVCRYVWTYNYCAGVPYVGKTDDNVELNIPALISVLSSRKDKNKQFIACSVPSRNIATGRLTRPHMRGNWSLTKVRRETSHFSKNVYALIWMDVVKYIIRKKHFKIWVWI